MTCNKNAHVVWANALLSDGEILFWYIGDRCGTPHDFYKDFYYAGLNLIDYAKFHHLEVQRMGFLDETEDKRYNNFSFEVLASKFFRQFPISKDSRGAKPYDL